MCDRSARKWLLVRMCRTLEPQLHGRREPPAPNLTRSLGKAYLDAGSEQEGTVTTRTRSGASTRGVIYVHSAPSALCPHIEWARSEEHTSELQSRQYLVCRLLLENKKHVYNLQPDLYV